MELNIPHKKDTVQRIWECCLRWEVMAGDAEAIKNAQVIVTHCADLLTDDTAGNGNTLIAEHTNWLHERFNLPIIAQREILTAKSDLPVFAVVGAAKDGKLRTRPADTYEICTEQKKICDKNGWENVLVVTFPDHMWRACEVYKKIGLNPIPALMRGNPNIYYHPKAKRWQLRSRFKFKYFWEIPARLLFLKRDWI